MATIHRTAGPTSSSHRGGGSSDNGCGFIIFIFLICAVVLFAAQCVK